MLPVLADAADDSRNFVEAFMTTLIVKTNGVALRMSQDNFDPIHNVSGFQGRGIGEMKI